MKPRTRRAIEIGLDILIGLFVALGLWFILIGVMS